MYSYDTISDQTYTTDIIIFRDCYQLHIWKKSLFIEINIFNV